MGLLAYGLHLPAIFLGRIGPGLAAASPDGLVRLWDATAGNELLVLRPFGLPGTGHFGYTPRVVFSSDGRRLAANNWDGTVSIWDAGTQPTPRENPMTESCHVAPCMRKTFRKAALAAK